MLIYFHSITEWYNRKLSVLSIDLYFLLFAEPDQY